jgi:asparagine synthase (glutamine-hydrolysing)
MCGIAGILGGAKGDPLQKMIDSMIHRGPDDQGIFIDEQSDIGLGQRRLSIIDLSMLGHQPMSFDNKQYWITFNGEIYNFMELRAELEQSGLMFKSCTDTEVVLAAYVRWGADCLRRLRGMFAFAIWDSKKRCLFLARDRFGIKPLYYAKIGQRFIFASEIKAMLVSGLISRQVDRQAIWDYLSHGSILQPRTILNDVKMLLPGHYLMVTLKSITQHRYWELKQETQKRRGDLSTISYDDAVIELRSQLEQATRLHLIADVPVGAFLSGGVDSTIVVGLMSKLLSYPLKTFSVGFGPEFRAWSEDRWAKIASIAYNTDHHEVYLDGDIFAKNFDEMIDAIDQPSIDGANTFIVSKAAAEHVTVALSGLGGDELMAGYPHFHRIPWAYRIAGDGWTKLRPIFDVTQQWLPGKIREPLKYLICTPLDRYTILRPFIGEKNKWAITQSEWKHQFNPKPIQDFYSRMVNPNWDPVTDLSYVEINGYLRDTLLRDCDAMSMAHSLEVRPLLIDHVLAEFIFSLPSHFKITGQNHKRILLDACKDLLPSIISNRPKMGFSFPTEHWLQSKLRERVLNILESDPGKTIFSAEFLSSCRRKTGSKIRHQIHLWPIVVLLSYISHHHLVYGNE